MSVLQIAKTYMANLADGTFFFHLKKKAKFCIKPANVKQCSVLFVKIRYLLKKDQSFIHDITTQKY